MTVSYETRETFRRISELFADNAAVAFTEVSKQLELIAAPRDVLAREIPGQGQVTHFWHDVDRIGQYIPGIEETSTTSIPVCTAIPLPFMNRASRRATAARRRPFPSHGHR